MPGARRTHCLACKTKKTHAGQHRYAEITPALPAQWFYGCSVLSLVSGLFSHHRPPISSVRRRTSHFDRLDPSVGGSGPHGLTVRDRAARLAAQRVHRNPPHVW